MNGARIIYTPRPDATPEAELDALAAIYCFVLTQSGASKRVTEQALSPTAATTTEGYKQGKEASMV